ncbi:MAG: hypothetical protein ACRD41_02935 [Candidatus Acidiferrales bacterium]
MTRCLNCGSPRDADLCAECGLETSAAEFSLRKKLLNRTAVFLLGSIAFVVAAVRYPALELDGILIFMGVLFFLTLAVAVLVERGALSHAEVEIPKRIYFALIPLPWLLAGLLLANGTFDVSPVRIEPAHVVGKFSMPGPVPSRRLIVNSWREGHRFERIAVDGEDFDRFNTGDPIEIRIHEGLASIPWVSGVSTP